MAFRKAADSSPQSDAAVSLRDAWQITSGTGIRFKRFDRRPAAILSRPNAKAASSPWSTPRTEVVAAYPSSEAPNAQISRLQLSHGNAEALAGALIAEAAVVPRPKVRDDKIGSVEGPAETNPLPSPLDHCP